MENVILEPFPETIPAGEYKTIHFYSKMLTILSNTASENISIGIGELRPVLLKAGLQYELPQGETFNKIVIYNQSDEETEVEIILSVGKITDNRLTLTGSTFDDLLAQQQGDTTPENWGDEKTIGVANSEVLAANTDRKGFSVQAKASNTGIIYIGFGSSVATTKWVAQLQAGMSYSRDNYRGDIYAISDTAGMLLGWEEV